MLDCLVRPFRTGTARDSIIMAMRRPRTADFDQKRTLTISTFTGTNGMRKFIMDCSKITSEMDLWERYVEVTRPEGLEFFGYNINAFNDAITGGGPGWPGDCEIYFTNTWQIKKFCGESFYKGLQEIANASTSARIFLEPPVATKKQ